MGNCCPGGRGYIQLDDENDSETRGFERQPRTRGNHAHIEQDGVAVVFWDLENCRIPNDVHPAAIVKTLRTLRTSRGFTAKRILATAFLRNLPVTVGEALVSSGVDLLDCPSSKPVPSNFLLLEEIQKWTLFNRPTEAGLIIITNDRDFGRRLSLLTDVGYDLLLIHLPGRDSETLQTIVHHRLLWPVICQDNASPVRTSRSSTVFSTPAMLSGSQDSQTSVPTRTISRAESHVQRHSGHAHPFSALAPQVSIASQSQTMHIPEPTSTGPPNPRITSIRSPPSPVVMPRPVPSLRSVAGAVPVTNGQQPSFPESFPPVVDSPGDALKGRQEQLVYSGSTEFSAQEHGSESHTLTNSSTMLSNSSLLFAEPLPRFSLPPSPPPISGIPVSPSAPEVARVALVPPQAMAPSLHYQSMSSTSAWPGAIGTGRSTSNSNGGQLNGRVHGSTIPIRQISSDSPLALPPTVTSPADKSLSQFGTNSNESHTKGRAPRPTIANWQTPSDPPYALPATVASPAEGTLPQFVGWPPISLSGKVTEVPSRAEPQESSPNQSRTTTEVPTPHIDSSINESSDQVADHSSTPTVSVVDDSMTMTSVCISKVGLWEVHNLLWLIDQACFHLPAGNTLPEQTFTGLQALAQGGFLCVSSPLDANPPATSVFFFITLSGAALLKLLTAIHDMLDKQPRLKPFRRAMYCWIEYAMAHPETDSCRWSILGQKLKPLLMDGHIKASDGAKFPSVAAYFHTAASFGMFKLKPWGQTGDQIIMLREPFRSFWVDAKQPIVDAPKGNHVGLGASACGEQAASRIATVLKQIPVSELLFLPFAFTQESGTSAQRKYDINRLGRMLGYNNRDLYIDEAQNAGLILREDGRIRITQKAKDMAKSIERAVNQSGD